METKEMNIDIVYNVKLTKELSQSIWLHVSAV